jgi:S-methylmethionine-dependent homocysteine/selenocysteine methylase
MSGFDSHGSTHGWKWALSCIVTARRGVLLLSAMKSNAKYRDQLPQLSDRLFLTDGGIETTLIYNEGVSLPYFAAFDLLKNDAGQEVLRKYFRTHAAIARHHRVGFVLESATWRASGDWGAKLGYTPEALAEANERAVALLREIRDELETDETPMVISGCIGPRGDGYKADQRMTAREAEEYHAIQAAIFQKSEADLITAITMTYSEEAIGLVRAARAAGMPVAVSFTTETDGRLPSGQGLRAAIEQVDAATNSGPAYYMINCAHPSHFTSALHSEQPWVRRIRGLRANASTKSHAELDQATDLDAGNPQELGSQYRDLRRRFTHLNVLGGCCGTDHRHVDAICKACLG